MAQLDFNLILEPVELKTCKGRVFRYHEAVFIGAKGRICVTKELRPLKMMSCPGCENCGPNVDGLADIISDVGVLALEFDANLVNGDAVYLALVPTSYDWESSEIEDWLYAVKKVQPLLVLL